MCEIYDLSKPDELSGVIPRESILPLATDPAMNALFLASKIVVMESIGRVIGFCGSRDSYITWLFVHPAFRRKGVATALIHEMLARLRKPVTLNVMMSNTPARAFYERIGFSLEREFQGNFQGNPCNVAKLRYESAA